MDEVIEVSDDESDLYGNIDENYSKIKCERNEETSCLYKQEFFTYVADRNYNNQTNSLSCSEDNGKLLQKIGEHSKYGQNYLRNDILSTEVKHELDNQGDYNDALSDREKVQDLDAKEIVHQFIDSHGTIWNNDAGTIEQCFQKMEAPIFDALVEDGTAKDIDRQTYTTAIDSCTTSEIKQANFRMKLEVKVDDVTDTQISPSDISKLECNTEDSVETQQDDEETNHFSVEQRQRYLSVNETNRNDNVRDHIDDVPSNVKKFKCLLCDFATTTQVLLKRHVERVHLKVKYKCNLCDYQTRDRTHFVDHLSAAHSKEILKCQTCDFETCRKWILISHVNNVHLKLSNFKCLMCEFSSPSKSDLRKHIKAVHTKKKDYKCRICDYRADTQSCIEDHMNTVHPDLVQYKCKLCSYLASRNVDLKNHVNVVHLKLKNHKCDMCDYKTNRQFDLNDHVNSVHLKLKKFKCQLCDYAAGRKNRLNRHIEYVHLMKRNRQLCS